MTQKNVLLDPEDLLPYSLNTPDIIKYESEPVSLAELEIIWDPSKNEAYKK